MPFYTSKSTPGFFHSEVHENRMPEDAQAITDELHASLLSDQAAGKTIDFSQYPPVAVDRGEVDVEDLKNQVARGLVKAASQAILSGFKSSTLGSEFTYPCGQTDQLNLNRATQMALLNASNSAWTAALTCQDGVGAWVRRDHTASQVQQVARDCHAHIESTLNTRFDLGLDLDKAKTPEGALGVTWPT